MCPVYIQCSIKNNILSIAVCAPIPVLGMWVMLGLWISLLILGESKILSTHDMTCACYMAAKGK